LQKNNQTKLNIYEKQNFKKNLFFLAFLLPCFFFKEIIVDRIASKTSMIFKKRLCYYNFLNVIMIHIKDNIVLTNI